MNEDPSNASMNRMFNNEGPVTSPQTTPAPETQPVMSETPAPQMNTVPVTPVENNTTPAVAPMTVPTSTPPQKEQKSVAFPLIMILLILCLGGYLAYTYLLPTLSGGNNNTSTGDNTNVVEETKDKAKEKDKEKDKEEGTEKEDTKEETPKSEASTAPESNGTASTDNTQPENNAGSSAEVDFISGTILYLYSGEGNGIGMDEVFFRYVSHTSNQIVVDVTFNDGPAQRYTFTLGQEKKISGVKNPIIIEQDPSEEYFSINFK